ncbi:transposase [Kingella negevensis]|uniref:Tc1-like transposase DDE domain-containing protein n=1 Tax=Kingella negevensis TaxID=1522312 RepID=A0A238HH96_9NEIS|nr:Uncharacterised protein [Kingella negevensis]
MPLNGIRQHSNNILDKILMLTLTPYSPELNPIEKTWANIKKYMRSILPSYDNFTDVLLVLFLF